MPLSRPTQLALLGAAGVALLTVLALNVQESRTIVVAANQAPTLPTTASATLVSELAAPRFTGQNAQGSWELTAATASQQAAGTQAGATQGVVQLRSVTAKWLPHSAPALGLQAPTAQFEPSSTLLKFANGLTATGQAGAYQVAVTAAAAMADLSASTLKLVGGVSATLTPR